METLLKFNDLFIDPEDNIEILGTKIPRNESENFCQHCGKKIIKALVIKNHENSKIFIYGIPHAAQIMGFENKMNDFKKMITKANKKMLLQFAPKMKSHKLYPNLRWANNDEDRDKIRIAILQDLEEPNCFLPDVNAKGM